MAASSTSVAGSLSVPHDREDAETTVAEVYDRHCDYVFRVLRHLGVSERVLEDAVQDVFEVVVKRAGEFEGRASFRTWLYGIALRVARAHRRRAARSPLADDEPDRNDPRAGPEERAVHARELRLVLAVLDELPEPFREVFVLAEIEGLSGPEIAESTSLKLNTVYSRLRLARRRFRTALQERQPNDGEDPT